MIYIRGLGIVLASSEGMGAGGCPRGYVYSLVCDICCQIPVYRKCHLEEMPCKIKMNLLHTS